MITVKQSKDLWVFIVDKYFRDDDCYEAIGEKLKRIKFIADGEMKPGKLRIYAEKHFPSLINIYQIKRQALEIPKREKRIRTEHHAARRKQMNMFKGNQLDLF